MPGGVDYSGGEIELTRQIGMFSLLVFVVFSAVVLMFAPEKMWDWLIQVSAVFIGAFLALAGGVLLFGYQQRETNKARRKDLRRLVRAELEETYQRLQSSGATEPEPTALDQVQPLAIEEAVRSSLFSPSLSQDLMSIARQFHTYNRKVLDILALPGRYDLTSEEGEERLRSALFAVPDGGRGSASKRMIFLAPHPCEKCAARLADVAYIT